MKTLSVSAVIAKVKTIRKGTFHSIEYCSYKDTTNGTPIIKVTKTVARLGIDYTHIDGYVPSTRTYTNNSTVVVPNTIKTNAKTGNTLVTIYPNYKQSRSHYEDLNGNIIDKSVALAMLKPSSKPNGNPPKCIAVNAANIIKI